MGTGREGTLTSSSFSLCVENFYPQTGKQTGGWTLESTLGRHRLEREGAGRGCLCFPVPSIRPHRFFITTPSLATWFAVGAATPGSSLSQPTWASCFVLGEGEGASLQWLGMDHLSRALCTSQFWDPVLVRGTTSARSPQHLIKDVFPEPLPWSKSKVPFCEIATRWLCLMIGLERVHASLLC